MPPQDDIVDGTAVELEEARGLTVREAEPMGLARAPEPGDMIALATRMADALSDIVEKKHLYATISNKKFPTVEAWMTVARMDNVVAREVPDGIVALEDGSYEATVELIRLSDGAIIGRGSALCGSEGDSPWDKRPRPQRRSMAVTRATSRAFRQQYSWIMALAGYEPTPAEEMPREERPRDSGGRGGGPVDGTRVPHPVAEADTTTPWLDVMNMTVTGLAHVGAPPVDLELRPTADGGYTFGFKLNTDDGKWIPQAIAEGSLAADIADASVGSALLWTQPITVTGDLYRVPWERPRGHAQPPYQRLIIKRLTTAEWTLPLPEAKPDPVDEAELDAVMEKVP